jgi:hypothetical protein
MKTYINKLGLLALSLMILVWASSCKNEDFTGDSTAKPTKPSIAIEGSGSYTSNELSQEIYNYKATLSEVQVSDVYFYIFASEGTAVEDVNYELSDHKIVIPKGLTTAEFSVSILNDPTANPDLTFTLQVGDERTGNAELAPVMSNFTINNNASGDMVITLEWGSANPFIDINGGEISATDMADLRLLVVDAALPYTSILGGADGASFESYTMSSAFPDGTYHIVADFYGAADLGDQGNFSLDLAVGFDQAGVINGTKFAFSGAIDNCSIAPVNHYYLAQLTKVGEVYTVTEVGQHSFDFVTVAGGTYTELMDDGSPQTSTVTLTAPDANGAFTVTNALYSSPWWCGMANATLELVVTGNAITFPGGATTQVVGGIDNMCGVYGPVSATLNSTGNFDACTGVISFSIETTVAAGSFGDADVTYTP